MKKTLFILPLFVFQAWLLSSCSQAETYAEQKDKEYKAINSFLGRDIVVRDRDGNVVCNVGKIKTISEETFLAQDSTTDLSQNEYVLFSNSGVYMQIVRQGCGDKLEANKAVNILCRFEEYNILADSLLASNKASFWFYNSTLQGWVDGSQYVDKMNVTRTGTTITASFMEGVMLMRHPSSSSVPSGWLVPLNYVYIGRPENENDEIAQVRLIVPHSQGTADASSSVYPCYYEITYMREK